MTTKAGFKGFGLTPKHSKEVATLNYKGKSYDFPHGSIVIAAITSCTNTSNPDSMVQAGLLAKNAVEKGLSVRPYIKTTLSPGSGVVTKQFESIGLNKYLNKIGFYTAGYGCMTCIGNTGDLEHEISECITKNDVVASAVLSGNRNFEGRVHPLTKANYLASPALVVAYALAGRIDIDFEKEPIGKDKNGQDVFLRDIWPKRDQVRFTVDGSLKSEMFKEVYGRIAQGTTNWNNLKVSEKKVYDWKPSTYIHKPPFFEHTSLEI